MASLDEFSREQVILSALRTTGRVAVSDLSARFGVSSVTVRKDLDALERRSLLRRVRGGAVSLGASDEGSFEARFTDSRDRKQAIAKAAAAAVRDGDVIAIDSSTTAFYLAQELVERRGLVVVTNGLRLATLFMEQSSARVLVLGGVLRRSAGSLVGPIGDVLSSRGRIAKGFFGLVGLSAGPRADGCLGRGGPDQARHGRRLRRGARPVRLDEDHRVRPAPVRRGGPGQRALDRRRGARGVRRRLAGAGGRGPHRVVPTSHRRCRPVPPAPRLTVSPQFSHRSTPRRSTPAPTKES
jgi:DeoR/GlpR family transcriptional regulator of sugar metabolism